MKRISTIREFVDSDLGRFFSVIYDAIEHDVPALYFVHSCKGDIIPKHLTTDYAVHAGYSMVFRNHVKAICTKQDWHFSESLEAMYEADLIAVRDIIEISLHERVKYGKAN